MKDNILKVDQALKLQVYSHKLILMLVLDLSLLPNAKIINNLVV